MARKVAAQGIAMLPEDCWGSNHNLTFQLYLGTDIRSRYLQRGRICSFIHYLQSGHSVNI